MTDLRATLLVTLDVDRRRRQRPDRRRPTSRPIVTDWRGRYHGARARRRPPGDRPTKSPRSCAAAPACGVADRAAGRQHRPVRRRHAATRPATRSCCRLTRMNRVRALDAANATMTVEAGVHAGRACSRRPPTPGLLFPLSLASEGSCTIGGNLSTNAGGTAVLRYGNARELVLGLEVVLADGRDLERPARPAQGQHRLRPEAALHRRRRHARHRHRGGAEALSRAAHARRPRWPRSPTSAAAVALLRAMRQALGDRLTGFELMSRDCARACRASTIPRCPIRCPAIPGTCWCRPTTAPPIRRSRRKSKRRSRAAIEAGDRARRRRSRSRRSRRPRCGRCARTSPKRSGAKDPTSSTTSRCRSSAIPAFLDDARRGARRGVSRRALRHLRPPGRRQPALQPRRAATASTPRAFIAQYGRAPTASSTIWSPRSAAASAPSTASAS